MAPLTSPLPQGDTKDLRRYLPSSIGAVIAALVCPPAEHYIVTVDLIFGLLM
jgi:hypothetical protein